MNDIYLTSNSYPEIIEEDMISRYILFSLIGVVIALTGCTSQTGTGKKPKQTTTPVASSATKQLKLETFKRPAPSPPKLEPPSEEPPPPSDSCMPDTIGNPAGSCKCPPNEVTIPQCPPAASGEEQDPATCPFNCWAKPVIYLYPQVPTLTSVKLTIPGTIIASDPLYPSEGWQNVLALPDGTLFYNGKTYHELFYETSVWETVTPTAGIVVPSAFLEITLQELTTKLGLMSLEQQDFLDYWLPKVQNLHSPYIFISILSPQEKDRVDKVEITPRPDTRIEFLVYFKPLQTPMPTLPLTLSHPPKRNGFTFVEWGGTIAQ